MARNENPCLLHLRQVRAMIFNVKVKGLGLWRDDQGNKIGQTLVLVGRTAGMPLSWAVGAWLVVRFKAGLISSLISYHVNQFGRQNRSQYEECWDKGKAQYSGDNVVAGGRKMARREYTQMAWINLVYLIGSQGNILLHKQLLATPRGSSIPSRLYRGFRQVPLTKPSLEIHF